MSDLLLAADLEIRPEDVYVEFVEGKKGFSLFLRAREGLGSIMITESTADPAKKVDSFAWRSKHYNDINGNEKRILNGIFLESEKDLYFLLDSTSQSNEILGEAFEIFIPFKIVYGYSWSREGEFEVHRGTWLNIRAFERRYADYSGSWSDNPFVLSMKELPLPPSTPVNLSDDSVVPKVDIEPVIIGDVKDAMERISTIVERADTDFDLVLVVDTTISMKDDIQYIRDTLVPTVLGKVSNFESFRVGMVFYRDYKEAYLTKSLPFTNDLDMIQTNINRADVSGGRDINEAVLEGLYAALTEFPWKASERMIIQIGDADKHEVPKGAINEALVKQEANKLGVSIYPMRLMDKADKR